MNEQDKRMLGLDSLQAAEHHLKVATALGGLYATSPLSQVATIMLARRTEDDADPLDALVKVLQLLLADQLPAQTEHRYDPENDTHREMRVTKAQLLGHAVHALERVVGQTYQTVPVPGGSLVNLNEAGERSAVRPEAVPGELRDHTIRFWQEQHAKMSEQHPDVDLATHPYAVDEACRWVDAAIAAGAFIVPYEEMPPKQKQFWLQRAAGLEHKLV